MSTKRTLITLVAALAFASSATLSGTPALADSPPPPSLSVMGSGSIQYTPDIARLSLGVRAESPNATTASKTVNARAQAVIDALRRLGIPDSQIATSGYSLEYQPPPQPDNGGAVPQPAPAQGEVQTMSIARKPLPTPGTYVATETIDVKTSVAKAGAALDAGITSGANQSYGLSFDTSQRQLYYRKALARAVVDARSQAEVLARSAGLQIVGVQSISVGGGGGPVPLARFSMAAEVGPAPPVMGGTGTIDVTVNVVYRIR